MRKPFIIVTLVVLSTAPALAQQPSPQQQFQQTIALKIGALELENAQLAAAVQQDRSEMASLKAENEKLKDAARGADKPAATPRLAEPKVSPRP